MKATTRVLAIELKLSPLLATTVAGSESTREETDTDAEKGAMAPVVRPGGELHSWAEILEFDWPSKAARYSRKEN